MQHTQWLDRALSSAMCAGGLLWHLPAAVLGVQCKETVLYTYYMYATGQGVVSCCPLQCVL